MSKTNKTVKRLRLKKKVSPNWNRKNQHRNNQLKKKQLKKSQHKNNQPKKKLKKSLKRIKRKLWLNWLLILPRPMIPRKQILPKRLTPPRRQLMLPQLKEEVELSGGLLESSLLLALVVDSGSTRRNKTIRKEEKPICIQDSLTKRPHAEVFKNLIKKSVILAEILNIIEA